MKVKIQVRSQKKEPWTSEKTKKENIDRVLMGPDEDFKDGQALESMMMLNVPQDQWGWFDAGNYCGKVVEFGVSRLMPFGGAVKFFGKVLSVDGKALNGHV
jgi:hypothetical protein